MIDRSRITGLVLAGGRGARMGSVDKGLVPFHGRPLVEHAIERLAPQVGALVISANRHVDRYAAWSHPVVRDAGDGHDGPLAGLLAGLRTATTEFVAVVPCDAPFFPHDLVARLADRLDDDAVDACVASADRLHPVFCVVRTRAACALDRAFVGGERRVTGWLAGVRHRPVSFADESAFRNLNTVDALRDAETATDR